MSAEGPRPHFTSVHDPIVSVIAAGPDEMVPQGVLWDVVLLPSLNTDEVKTWIAQNRTGPVFVAAGVDIASKGTPALPVHVSEDEYNELLAAMPR